MSENADSKPWTSERAMGKGVYWNEESGISDQYMFAGLLRLSMWGYLCIWFDNSEVLGHLWRIRY